jgi:hypothetical protein
VKISLGFLKTSADNADRAASNANAAATAANNAYEGVQGAISDVVDAVDDKLAAFKQTIAGEYNLIPTGLKLDYPRVITYRNTAPKKIGFVLLPTDTGRNVLFLPAGGDAVEVHPATGELTVKQPGVSRIYAIPTENSNLHQVATIQVVEPGALKLKSGGFLLTSNGGLILT